MSLNIKTEAIFEALTPWFNADIIESSGLCQTIVQTFRSYYFNKRSFGELYKKIDSHLFMSLYKLSKGTMRVLVDGKVFRFDTTSFPYITDDILGIYFFSIPKNIHNFEEIKHYSLHTESLSSLKALYILYRDIQSEEEIDIIKKLIKNLYPNWRYMKWINA